MSNPTTENFRDRARKLLAKAEELLATGDEDDLESATLKLRKTMEALTYERSKGYAEDLGPKAMKTWQPKKLMERMLEVDPYADKAATVAMGVEPSYGEKPETMTVLGTDHVMDMKTLKKHYDALGAYLHTETLDQIENGKTHDLNKLRSRCEKIVQNAETILSSQIFNSTITKRGEFECRKCKAMIQRRLAKDGESRIVSCWDCLATYDLKYIGDQKVLFDPRMHYIPCPVEDCEGTYPLWEKELVGRTCWACRECGTKQRIALCVAIEEEPVEQTEDQK